MSSMHWVAGQLAQNMAAKFSEPTSQPRFNPRPPGIIRQGSGTWEVLQFLRANNGKYWSCFQLCRHTGASIKAVNHACLYLREKGLVHTCPDPRNPQYLRYSIAKGV